MADANEIVKIEDRQVEMLAGMADLRYVKRQKVGKVIYARN